MMKVIASGVIALFGALFATASLAYEANPSVMLIPSGAEVEYLDMEQIDLAAIEQLDADLLVSMNETAVLPALQRLSPKNSTASHLWRSARTEAPPADLIFASGSGCHLPLRI